MHIDGRMIVQGYCSEIAEVKVNCLELIFFLLFFVALYILGDWKLLRGLNMLNVKETRPKCL